MTDNIQLTMPIADDIAAEKGGNITPSKRYKPLPEVSGTSFTNELFIPLYSPAAWSMFNLDQETATRLGASLENPLKVAELPELYTFYFRIPTHSVQKFQRDDGYTGYASVVCPIKLNYFLEKHIKRNPMFIRPRCPFCEAAAQSWEEHNARWEEMGIDKRNLSKDGYRDAVKADAVLSETYHRAKSYNIQEKVIMNVFDHNKFTGERPLAEGEALEYQTWFAPRVVLQGLVASAEASAKHNLSPFYDFANPNGLQLTNVTKNTEKCTVGNFRDTAYTHLPGVVYPYADDWRSYLTNLANMPDPSASFVMLPYAEAAVYAEKAAPKSFNKPAAAPAPQAPQTAAPAPQTAAPAPQAAAPVVAPPPVAAAAPPPVAAAPVVAPPPVAAAAPPPVAAAPVVAPPPVAAAAPPPVAGPPAPPGAAPAPTAPAPSVAPPPAPVASAPPSPVVPAVAQTPVRDDDDSDNSDGIAW